jgi:hypothetical protein
MFRRLLLERHRLCNDSPGIMYTSIHAGSH